MFKKLRTCSEIPKYLVYVDLTLALYFLASTENACFRNEKNEIFFFFKKTVDYITYVVLFTCMTYFITEVCIS